MRKLRRARFSQNSTSAVLPCEMSEGIRMPDAVTEAAAFLTAAERFAPKARFWGKT